MGEAADVTANWAKAADAWAMAAIKYGIIFLVVLLFWQPPWMPRVADFVGRLNDVEIAGVKVQLDNQTKELLVKHSVTFDQNNNMFVAGVNVNDFDKVKGQLLAQVSVLQDQNNKLAQAAKTQNALLAQAFGKLSAAGDPAASDPLLVEAVGAAGSPVVADAASAGNAAAAAAQQIAKPNPAAPASPQLGYGVVFSSDEIKPDRSEVAAAQTEIDKVRAFYKGDVGLYRRGKYLASVAVFETREQAFAALPQFSAALPGNGPFYVNIGVWCPAAKPLEAAAPAIAETTCGF